VNIVLRLPAAEVFVIQDIYVSGLYSSNFYRLCMDACVQYITAWFQFKFNVPQDEQTGKPYPHGHRRYGT
jgi:hypothetical protein